MITNQFLFSLIFQREFPVGIVNAGYSNGLGMACRFHKTEIRMNEFAERDFNEYQFRYQTSPAPSYPFGGAERITWEHMY